MNLHDNILIQRNAISPEDLAYLADHARQAQKVDSLVSRFAEDVPDGVVEWTVNKEIRDTQEIELPDAVTSRIRRIDDTSIQAFIDSFYQVTVRDREPSQILHYGVGGHYTPHVDAETLYRDDIGLDLWEKTLDRDLSVVYFLNDDFAGGELVFPTLDLVVKPEAGTLVCFPSDHNYIHGVNAVTAGHRYTLVTWMRVEGMPAPDEINERTLEAYNRAWPEQFEQPPRMVRGGSRT